MQPWPAKPCRRRRPHSAAAARRERTPLSVAAFQLPKTKWWEATCPPNVVHVNSVQEMVDAMVRGGTCSALSVALALALAQLLLLLSQFSAPLNSSFPCITHFSFPAG